jgi:hypothetical protein
MPRPQTTHFGCWVAHRLQRGALAQGTRLTGGRDDKAAERAQFPTIIAYNCDAAWRAKLFGCCSRTACNPCSILGPAQQFGYCG